MVLDVGPLFDGSVSVLPFEGEIDLSNEKMANQVLFPEKMHVMGEVSARAGMVSLAYSAEGHLETVCDLCLDPISEVWDENFSHNLTLEPNIEEPVLYVTCPNAVLDVSRMVLSDVFLSLPIRFVCKSDCKGLCDRCGKNLNEGPCSCPAHEIDPRLLPLQKLLEESKKEHDA